MHLIKNNRGKTMKKKLLPPLKIYHINISFFFYAQKNKFKRFLFTVLIFFTHWVLYLSLDVIGWLLLLLSNSSGNKDFGTDVKIGFKFYQKPRSEIEYKKWKKWQIFLKVFNLFVFLIIKFIPFISFMARKNPFSES